MDKNTDNTALVCKRCGYKQSDEDTIDTLKSHFPSMEPHDIPYYCGACMDYANDDERAEMEQKMSGLSDPQIAGSDVSMDEGTDDSLADFVRVTRCKDCECSEMYCFGPDEEAVLACVEKDEEDGQIYFAKAVDPMGYCSCGKRKTTMK